MIHHHCNCETWAGGKCTCANAVDGLNLQSTVTFSCTAGLLSRRQVKNEILAAARNLGLTISVQEDKGWLESYFHFTVTGKAETIYAFIHAVQVLAENNA